MRTIRFGQALLMVGTLFVFGIIYQHNLIIRLSYAKQRLELKKNKLIKEQNDLRQKIYQLKNPSNIRAWAVERQGMRDLCMSHVITLTTQKGGDFFHAP